MSTKEKARWQAGRKNTCACDSSESATARYRVRAAVKSLVVTLAIWRVLPYGLADGIIRRLRLRGS